MIPYVSSNVVISLVGSNDEAFHVGVISNNVLHRCHVARIPEPGNSPLKYNDKLSLSTPNLDIAYCIIPVSIQIS